MTEVMHLQDSGLRKIFSTCITISFLVNMSLLWPHCGRICASSGQWIWWNIFHNYHNPAFAGLFSCGLCEKTCDSPGKYVLEIFSRKTLNFLCRSCFAPLCLSLCIFNMVAVTKYLPQWSQDPCLWGFLSHELVYRITHLGSWFWYNLQGSGFDKIFSTPITILPF